MHIHTCVMNFRSDNNRTQKGIMHTLCMLGAYARTMYGPCVTITPKKAPQYAYTVYVRHVCTHYVWAMHYNHAQKGTSVCIHYVCVRRVCMHCVWAMRYNHAPKGTSAYDACTNSPNKQQHLPPPQAPRQLTHHVVRFSLGHWRWSHAWSCFLIFSFSF